MTGYGAATSASPNYKVTVEIKSLNSKYFELTLRLPRIYLKYEHKLRATLGRDLERGKVILFLNVQVLNSDKRSLNVNQVLAQSYLNELNTLREQLGISGEVDLPFLLGLPEVVPVDTAEPDPEEWDLIQQATQDATNSLIESRKQEGQALFEDLVARVNSIGESLQEVERLAPERIGLVRDRILQALTDVKGRIDYDPNRFEQELVFYIEKLAINEEIVRLKQHLTYFSEIKNSSENTGKQLNFIAQEMGREINTIGSKAQDAQMQRHVVRMKDELDKIKEQVLNII